MNSICFDSDKNSQTSRDRTNSPNDDPRLKSSTSSPSSTTYSSVSSVVPFTGISVPLMESFSPPKSPRCFSRLSSHSFCPLRPFLSRLSSPPPNKPVQETLQPVPMQITDSEASREEEKFFPHENKSPKRGFSSEISEQTQSSPSPFESLLKAASILSPFEEFTPTSLFDELYKSAVLFRARGRKAKGSAYRVGTIQSLAETNAALCVFHTAFKKNQPEDIFLEKKDLSPHLIEDQQIFLWSSRGQRYKKVFFHCLMRATIFYRYNLQESTLYKENGFLGDWKILKAIPFSDETELYLIELLKTIPKGFFPR